MNYFDFEIIKYLNQFSQHSPLFDIFTGTIQHIDLLKGGILVAIIWWAWFKKEDLNSHKREQILITLISCLVTIALVRVLALCLPFRFRPVHEEGLYFLLPIGRNLDTLSGWSSFPSDHAALFFAISTGLLFINRRAGLFAFIYSTLFIAFPRVYLGLHYPTDIFAGAIIGIAIATTANILFVKNKYIQSIVNLSKSKPEFFYPIFFLLMYQTADLYDGIRDLASLAYKLIKCIIS